MPKKKHPTHLWLVVGGENPCDVRRYAYSHRDAVGQLRHAHKQRRGFRDWWGGKGIWTLFKLVRVNKRRVTT